MALYIDDALVKSTNLSKHLMLLACSACFNIHFDFETARVLFLRCKSSMKL